MAASNTAQFIAYVAATNDATCKDMSIYLENASYTPAFDDKKEADSRKMDRVAGKPYVYTIVGDKKCSSTATNDLKGTFIVVCTTAATQYTFSFANVDGRQLCLKDHVMNIVTPITTTDTYTFSAEANSILSDRFEIVEYVPGDFTICHQNGSLVIDDNPYTTTNITVKNAEGEEVINVAPKAIHQEISLDTLPAGRYTVEFNGGEKKYIIAVKPELTETPVP